MKYIGIDIGTTTISGVLIDSSSGCVIKKKTLANTSQLKTDHTWMREQDPAAIEYLCRTLLKALAPEGERVSGIGLTGQMHGILFTDAQGHACSNLITWQDERGNQPFSDGLSCCEYMTQVSGYPAATGYGLTTFFYNMKNGLIPANAVQIATIPDYIAMRLTGNTKVITHASNAASLGCFDAAKRVFDLDAVQKLGIDPGFLPQIADGECIIGSMPDQTAVAVPIGDNQASFLGSVGSKSNVLLNIGTGSQISVLTDHFDQVDGLEYRPYIDGKYLINGSSLCGGSSYALLEHFFIEVLQMFGADTKTETGCLMKQMDEAAEQFLQQGISSPEADTRFRGTRETPSLRGSISNIDVANFTPGAFSYAVMRGICTELYDFYRKVPAEVNRPEIFVASGNAVRNSEVERRILSDVFQAPVMIPGEPEEAAYGSTLVAAHEVEGRSWEDLSSMIRYVSRHRNAS